MCRIWKMGRNLFSSLDIRDNFKVAFLEKNSNNPKIYRVTITVWDTGSVINWVNLSCWLPDLKVDIWQNLPKNATFKLSAMSNDEPICFFHFCIRHIKGVWILLKLEMALVTNIEMKSHGSSLAVGYPSPWLIWLFRICSSLKKYFY
jgi:hypothetical protein